MKPFHIRVGKYGRAFAMRPRNLFALISVFLRGWRLANWYPLRSGLMHKASRNQKELEASL